MDESLQNIAYIDGQNLYLGARESGWSVDYEKFRKYLSEKYHIKEAYYFLGFVNEDEQDLYDNLQKAGFILVFREHSSALKGKKKGNVDCDIVFSVMRKIAEGDLSGKVLIVSGDGDYIKLVNYLVKKKYFLKMLFPNKIFASSLYKKLGGQYYDYLENEDIRKKIQYKK
jgi:uncharacterized LabA/DUF88 family protein